MELMGEGLEAVFSLLVHLADQSVCSLTIPSAHLQPHTHIPSYLIDQFLQTSSNQRTDNYGGSIENRARFLFEVLDEVLKELPANRVAVRFSPWFNWFVPSTGLFIRHLCSNLLSFFQAKLLRREPAGALQLRPQEDLALQALLHSTDRARRLQARQPRRLAKGF